MKSFKHWKTQEVEEFFGIEEVSEHPLLEKWLTAQYEISEDERNDLKELQLQLKKSVHFWNEMELKMKFLGPLLALVKYDTLEYQAFMERSLVAKKGEETIVGTVDFLIAKGRQIPRSPFFSVHEYKPDPNASKDPLGQLLIALVAIHQSNLEQKHDFPLYGAYVVGQFFYFVVFDGKAYAKSQPYVASQDAIFEVFSILKEVKVYIEAIIEAGR
ncbi:MAG: hypothetical protein ACPGVB_03500 [Chitinophagales bacterium]